MPNVEQKSDLVLVRKIDAPKNTPLFIVGIPFLIGDLVVPAGFETDLASIPSFARSLVSKLDGVEAAVGHDYMYAMKMDKEEADEFFYAALKGAVPEWKRQAMYRAVKWFGGTKAYPERYAIHPDPNQDEY